MNGKVICIYDIDTTLKDMKRWKKEGCTHIKIYEDGIMDFITTDEAIEGLAKLRIKK